MAIVVSGYSPSRDPRLEAELAAHAVSAAPAWLWCADGSRLYFANAVGAAVFGAADCAAALARRFDPGHPAAAEIVRLAASLPANGQVRLERLRGFGTGLGGPGRAVTCVCSRFAAGDQPSAILVIATEPAGPALSLPERVGRLLSGRREVLAAFAPDGVLIGADPATKARLGGNPTLGSLGLEAIAAQARTSGGASGQSRFGAVSIERLGSSASTVLIVVFEALTANAASAAAAAEPARMAPLSIPLPQPSAIEPATATPPPTSNAVSSADQMALAERRHPLRFVWRMDTEGRFAVGSDEFIELVGPRTTAAFGRLWKDVAAELKLDPDGLVEKAVASRETWSGVVVSWPVDDCSERLPVELSGLPIFDRDRRFGGYRGFGVCRDIDRINLLVRVRREHPAGTMSARPPATEQTTVKVSPEPASQEAASAALTAATSPLAAAQVEADRGEWPSVPGANVVPFRATTIAEPKPPVLTPVERSAFHELAQELTARLSGSKSAETAPSETTPLDLTPPETGPHAGSEPASATLTPEAGVAPEQTAAPPDPAVTLLERLPVGILIYRHETLIYANRHFLEWSGYSDLAALAGAGGLDALFGAHRSGAPVGENGGGALTLVGRDGRPRLAKGRLLAVPWSGEPALALVLTSDEAEERARSEALSLGAAQREAETLRAKLASYQHIEDELRAARREAQKAAAAKADFLAKVSHEIRTPLNTITGFTEVILAERFGPIGNERYQAYLKDIHVAGLHLVAVLNDLLDLSKVETGQLDLAFANVSLNDLTQQCVGIMQPQASRARIIIRTSLTPGLPKVIADERSLRQIVLNLISNSIRFTGPGGQVIVSTAFADSGEAVLRVRDTGAGMSEKDVEAALEPFSSSGIAASWNTGTTGTSGLGLPLTKALAEANRAHFSIKTAPNSGTLVEVAFPPARVVAR
jgi:signal transduction histidine kinase